MGTISPKLEQAEMERARPKLPGNLNSYDFYLRGLAAYYQWTRESSADALSLFNPAIELDTNLRLLTVGRPIVILNAKKMAG